MLTLGIDTSTMTGGAALLSEHGLIGESVLNIRSTHSERLLPAIHRLLDDAEVTMGTIQGIAVATGPGSFTGLRIGMTTAKSMAYALETAVVGVTVLEALARQFVTSRCIVVPMIDARRSEVYAQPFYGSEALHNPWNTALDEVLEWCSRQSEPVLFCGDGAVLHQDTITQTVQQAVMPPREQRLLRSSSVAGLGRERLLAGLTSDAMALVPFYMRKSEAEMKWDAKN